MKFSRECGTEDQARAREAALLAAGYRAWSTPKPDGTWAVYWWADRIQPAA